MIKQMFKLVWNRKRTNMLVMVEVFFSFLVLFTVVTLAVYNWRLYHLPVGYSCDNTYLVGTGSIFQMDMHPGKGVPDELPRMLQALGSEPRVEAVAALDYPVLEIGSSNGGYRNGDRKAHSTLNRADDGLARALKIPIEEGRWFNSSEDGLTNIHPVVINRRLRRTLFGTGPAVGMEFTSSDGNARYRVMGVMTEFREDGDLQAPEDYFIERLAHTPDKPMTAMALLVRVRPGTDPGYAEQIITRLRSVSDRRAYQIEPLAEKRRGFLRFQMLPLIAGGLVAGFMLLMVALGMVGVVWQSVARRTREIGLRRALGGTARDICLQVLGELMMIVSAGLVVGSALVVQAPLLQMVKWLDMALFLPSLGISLALIYLLALGAGLYPSWLAMRVQPAEVLHHE